eukprot:6214827-Pleurochrysis_carterae.AAC.1
MPERLRGLTRNQIGSACAGSSPALSVFPLLSRSGAARHCFLTYWTDVIQKWCRYLVSMIMKLHVKLSKRYDDSVASVIHDHQRAAVFASVCSACHLGGYNAVRAEKTLQLDVLKENNMFAADAIEYQVTNGKNNMPAFGGRLTDDEITDVAYYVIYQSQAGWNKQPLYTKYPSKYVPEALMKAYYGTGKLK